MAKTGVGKKIRLGVVGVGRGSAFALAAEGVGMELVALCDIWEERLLDAGKRFGVTTYKEYDRFLEHEMDAVVLANFFHQHAPFAIKALESGRHVMSECAACHTLGEGVALARAVEKCGKIYMFAENYPYMLHNQEMRRLYHEGAIGDFLYGEGEYIHPGGARWSLEISPGINHWRNWIPSTYYCTHSVAPVMFVTDTRPVMVNGFVVAADSNDEARRWRPRAADTAGILMLRMDNGAMVKAMLGGLRGHQVFVRIHGNRGMMENMRVGDTSHLRLQLEPYGKEECPIDQKVYRPEWPEYGEMAEATGHGGGDFWTSFHFANAIRSGEQPYLNVYRAIDMSIAGVLAYKSALQKGVPIEVPDFRDETVRKQYENDDWSPDPERRRPGQPWPSILGEIKPSAQALAFAKEVWDGLGYHGD